VNPADVLEFWFGAPGSVEHGSLRKCWFEKDPAFDAEIRRRFLALVDEAAAGRLDGWADRPEGLLALIVLLDQFPRNLFRDTPRAFAHDAMALVLAQELVAGGHDRALPPAQRAFAYMPYMHSESRLVHTQAVQLFAQPGLEGNLAFALQHQAIIERFGRYPHRNAVLGRASSDEELAFLREPGSAF